MKFFNSIQLAFCFVVAPYVIAWLETATFKGASAAYISAYVLYFLGFAFVTVAIYSLLEKFEK
jgi:hypothetical protein